MSSLTRELRNIHPLYKRYWRDLHSQAYTEMRLKEEHYFRREAKDRDEYNYYCFCGRRDCKHGTVTRVYDLIGKVINCYECKREFVFMRVSGFPVRLICEECK